MHIRKVIRAQPRRGAGTKKLPSAGAQGVPNSFLRPEVPLATFVDWR